MMRGLRYILIVFIIIAGCQMPDEKEKVVSAIMGYNNELIKAFSTLNFESLKDFTTEKEFNKVYHYIMAYADQREKINTHIIDFSAKKIEIKNGSAEVVSHEKWVYERVNANSGKKIIPMQIHELTMNYELVKGNDNKWRVNSTNILKEEKLNIKDIHPELNDKEK